MSVEGSTMVVTGAASGIGAATATLGRSLGARVIGLDRAASADDLVTVDLADRTSIDAVLDTLPDKIDALCNVAGVPGTCPPEMVLAVNLLGLRHLTEALVDRLPVGGSVVNVASTAGSEWMSVMEPIAELLATADMADGLAWFERSAPLMPAYNFSKAALLVYSMRMAWAWRGRGVRVNSVSPGPVETPILPDFRVSMGESLLDSVSALVGRNGRPEEIARVVCFLADPDASWVSGCNVVVDGGFFGAVASGALDLASMMKEKA